MSKERKNRGKTEEKQRKNRGKTGKKQEEIGRIRENGNKK
jgi:hypothetical protein